MLNELYSDMDIPESSLTPYEETLMKFNEIKARRRANEVVEKLLPKKQCLEVKKVATSVIEEVKLDELSDADIEAIKSRTVVRKNSSRIKKKEGKVIINKPIAKRTSTSKKSAKKKTIKPKNKCTKVKETVIILEDEMVCVSDDKLTEKDELKVGDNLRDDVLNDDNVRDDLLNDDDKSTDVDEEGSLWKNFLSERVTVTFPEQPFDPFKKEVLMGDLLGPLFREVKEIRGWSEAEFFLSKPGGEGKRQVSAYDSLMSLGPPEPPYWLEAMPAGMRKPTRGTGPVVVVCTRVERQAPPLKLQLEERQPMDILYAMCSRHLQLPRDSFSLSFDGQTIKPEETPELLDISSNDIIEIHIKKR